ncbi:MAG: hypothetical protein JWP00_1568 [Chloroflexi bacterium]|jgi:hypothetical protein|nr:hypothetical protein [Chloroflexota bacterium]
MEKMQKAEHEFPEPGQVIGKIEPGDRFQRIKEMILLPEDDVSFTTEPHEAEDAGLPLMLLFLFGLMIFFGLVMFAIFMGVGNNWVNLTLGNHFTK